MANTRKKRVLAIVSDTDFRTTERAENDATPGSSPGDARERWPLERVGASAPTAVNGSDSGETPMR